MPGRDGADLAGTLRRRFPGLPIGLLTGYAHSPLIPAFEKSGMAVFKKPLAIQDLVDFLQREIG
jgi:FixJ family two-component response regulator